jgi:hypothetical protein
MDTFCFCPGLSETPYAVPAIPPPKTPTTRREPGFVSTTSMGDVVSILT